MEIRRFGIGQRRPDGPPGTHNVQGAVIDAGPHGVVAELALARHATIEVHSNPNTTWFVVIEGGGVVTVGSERSRVFAGEAVLWPAGVPHGASTELTEMRAIVVEFPPVELVLGREPRSWMAWCSAPVPGIVRLGHPGRRASRRPATGAVRPAPRGAALGSSPIPAVRPRPFGAISRAAAPDRVPPGPAFRAPARVPVPGPAFRAPARVLPGPAFRAPAPTRMCTQYIKTPFSSRFRGAAPHRSDDSIPAHAQLGMNCAADHAVERTWPVEIGRLLY